MKIKAIHPGEILREEFLTPLGISQYRLAKDIGIGAIGINQIVNEKRNISPEMALRLGAYFDTSPEFWLNLQNKYELEMLKDKREERYMLNGIIERRACVQEKAAIYSLSLATKTAKTKYLTCKKFRKTS
jgi:addiction module HigA family antidote